MSLDVDAIRKAYPNAVTIDDDTGAFDEIGRKITLVQSNIDTARNQLNTEAAAVKYKTDRREEYPEIGDQLDDLFHKGAFSTEMAANLQAVKNKYPKP